jgi:flagellar hook-associated protein FlgK
MGQAVMAQPAAQPPATAPAAPAPDADISVRQRSTLSPQDMMTQARDYRARMEGILKQLQGLVEQARKSKDVIRLNCLLDKLAQLKANIAIADSGLQSLQDAIGQRDEGQSVHEYTRVTIVNQKAQVLGAEGQACVGEDLSYVGATKVEVEHPGIEGDPTGPWTVGEPEPGFDRPPSASPFN